jgi:hypothetical protein
MANVSKHRRICLYTEDFDTLLPHHLSFLVAFGNMDTTYVHFFLKKKATLDNDDFFDNRQDCRITLFPCGRHGGDRSPDQNTLNPRPHMGETFVDMMVPTARYRLNTQGSPATVRRDTATSSAGSGRTSPVSGVGVDSIWESGRSVD